MKKTLLYWQAAGFAFTSLMGVLLHFLFDWTGQSAVIALFSAVNESIWEHMKLLFFPMLVFAFIQSRYLSDKYGNFWCVKAVGILTGTILIPVIYYTLNGAFGKMPDWTNIAVFFICAAISYILETYIFLKSIVKCKSTLSEILLLCAIVFVFMVFTFFPPHLPLFRDPVSLTYGY